MPTDEELAQVWYTERYKVGTINPMARRAFLAGLKAGRDEKDEEFKNFDHRYFGN